MYKVLFLTNIPSPNRVKFFTEFGKCCDLTVLFERNSASDRNSLWVEDKKENYNEIFLTNFNISNDNSIGFEVISYLNKNYDMIIIGMYSTCTAMIAISYLKVKKIPFVISTDGGFISCEMKIKREVKRFFISSASYWLASGNNAKLYLTYYGADPSRIWEYPFSSVRDNEVLCKPITKNEKMIIRDKLSINEEQIIIAVGQFIHRKGFDVLLNAFANIYDKNNVGLYLIGGCPTIEYQQIVKQHNLINVHFIDFLPPKELSNYYKAADFFVLPTREDIWGLVINEAMAYGLPVITTDACGAGLEMIQQYENGIIFPQGSIEKCRDALEYGLKNWTIKNQIKSLSTAHNYTIDKMVSEHERFLKFYVKS